jgi:hypothetical protein
VNADTKSLANAPTAAAGAQPMAVGFTCSTEAITALKWLALMLMIGDHVNKYVLHDGVPLLFILERLVVPLFAFVLGYNLGRPIAIIWPAHGRMMLRLCIFGGLACIPFIALNQLGWHWWPLNILFTLLVAVLVSWLLDCNTPISLFTACMVFIIGGALVEFWWPAVAACLFARAYFRQPSFWMFFGFILSVASLYVINGNFWALAALPVIAYAATFWTRPLPRAQWFFYAFYPLHLAVIWCYLRYMAASF